MGLQTTNPFCVAVLVQAKNTTTSELLALGSCNSPTGLPDVAMPAHLTTMEQSKIDRMVQSGKSVVNIIAGINNGRKKHEVAAVTRSTVYRFIKGDTHGRGLPEKRGRHQVLAKKDVAKLDQARKRLLKKADSERPVTYKAIHEEAGLEEQCSERTVRKALNDLGVRLRAPRHKVYLTKEDAKQRLKVAKKWVKRPASFWCTGVHAYVDDKAFPLPLTAAQKSKLQKRACGPPAQRTPPEAASHLAARPGKRVSSSLPSCSRQGEYVTC